MEKVTLSVNGKKETVEAELDMPLLWVLRDLLGLKGTKFGCGRGLCGSCTVMVDGSSTRSCQVSLNDIRNQKITTIESLGGDHPLQKTWLKNNVPQCGYCQPGQIMTALELYESKRGKKISDSEIDDQMGNNVCRCGTYQRIKKAIREAVEA